MNLSYLKKYRDLYKVQNPMAINSVVMKSSYKGLEQLIDFAYKYGFTEICLIPVSNTGPKEESIFQYVEQDIIEELEIIVSKMMKNTKGIFIRNLIPFDMYKRKKEEHNVPKDIQCDKLKNNAINDNNNFSGKDFFCRIPWKYLCVLSNQDIMPECYCNINKMLGNSKVDSLFDVWNGKTIQEYRQKISNHDNSICSEQCNSGLLADYKKF